MSFNHGSWLSLRERERERERKDGKEEVGMKEKKA